MDERDNSTMDALREKVIQATIGKNGPVGKRVGIPEAAGRQRVGIPEGYKMTTKSIFSLAPGESVSVPADSAEFKAIDCLDKSMFLVEPKDKYSTVVTRKAVGESAGPKVAGDMTIEDILEHVTQEQAKIDEEAEASGTELVKGVATKKSVDMVAQLMAKM